jgi:hypothetical protein
VGCSLCTYKCRGERRNGKTHTHALAHRASPGHGVARRWVQTHDMRVNSPPKSGPKPRRPTNSFCRLFFAMSSYLIYFDRDRSSQLRDAVTLGRSSLYIRAAAIKIVIKSTTTKTPTHLGFTASAAALPRLLHPVRRRASAIGRAGFRNHRP